LVWDATDQRRHPETARSLEDGGTMANVVKQFIGTGFYLAAGGYHGWQVTGLSSGSFVTVNVWPVDAHVPEGEGEFPPGALEVEGLTTYDDGSFAFQIHNVAATGYTHYGMYATFAQ